MIPSADGLVDAPLARAAIDALPSVAVVVGQLEIPQTATAAVFGAARARRATTVNPAPGAPLDAALVAATDWCRDPAEWPPEMAARAKESYEHRAAEASKPEVALG